MASAKLRVIDYESIADLLRAYLAQEGFHMMSRQTGSPDWPRPADFSRKSSSISYPLDGLKQPGFRFVTPPLSGDARHG
jgi:hypothetical protein